MLGQRLCQRHYTFFVFDVVFGWMDVIVIASIVKLQLQLQLH